MYPKAEVGGSGCWGAESEDTVPVGWSASLDDDDDDGDGRACCWGRWWHHAPGGREEG